MFSACTSIKVAASLHKVADLPKEHLSPLDPVLSFSSFFSGFHIAAVETCSYCRLVPAASNGRSTLCVQGYVGPHWWVTISTQQGVVLSASVSRRCPPFCLSVLCVHQRLLLPVSTLSSPDHGGADVAGPAVWVCSRLTSPSLFRSVRGTGDSPLEGPVGALVWVKDTGENSPSLD